MALNQTTLSAPVDAFANEIAVTSATGASAGRICNIEGELSVVLGVTGNMVKLRTRGDHGTASKAHNILAPVVFGDPTDFPAVPEARHRAQTQERDDVVTYGASGAIAVPTKNTTVQLGGSAALAMTIANPSPLQDGLEVKIVSLGAAAHTVTNASGFNAGGAAVDVATSNGAVGSTLVLRAAAGRWTITSPIVAGSAWTVA